MTSISDYAFGYVWDDSKEKYVLMPNFKIYGYINSAAQIYATKNGIPFVVLHIWDEGTVTTPATCKSEGVKTYTRTKCTETISKAVNKNPNNHDGGTEIRNPKTATCGAAGYTGDTYCLGCGAKLEDGQAIPATGAHTWDEGTVTT